MVVRLFLIGPHSLFFLDYTLHRASLACCIAGVYLHSSRYTTTYIYVRAKRQRIFTRTVIHNMEGYTYAPYSHRVGDEDMMGGHGASDVALHDISGDQYDAPCEEVVVTTSDTARRGIGHTHKKRKLQADDAVIGVRAITLLHVIPDTPPMSPVAALSMTRRDGAASSGLAPPLLRSKAIVGDAAAAVLDIAVSTEHGHSQGQQQQQQQQDAEDVRMTLIHMGILTATGFARF